MVLVDTGGLWFRVLLIRQKLKGVVWRTVVKTCLFAGRSYLVCIRNEAGLEVEGWFHENIRREIGNGENTFFNGLVFKGFAFKR